MSKKTLLLIAGVILVLAAATSAYGYREAWDGWFRTGTLYYNGHAYVNTETTTYGTAGDSTIGARDTFFEFTWPAQKAFVYSTDHDTIYLSISEFTGSKEYLQSGTKEGNGVWSGSAVRSNNGTETTWTTVSGTWDTNDGTECFDYTTEPDSYTAGWDVTYSNPGGANALTGWGTSYGERK